MFDLTAIQSALNDSQLDGWLLYDFRSSNVLAQRVLQLPTAAVGSRRFLYAIPAQGTPRKLVHRIESDVLDHLPGEQTVYLTWQEFEAGIAQLVDGWTRTAMEYSARNANPYISRVDAGTVELVRSLGTEVVSSGDLIQRFEATLTEEQWALHREAERQTVAGFEVAWNFIAEHVRRAGAVEETAVQDAIMDHFGRNGMVTYHAPIVAVNAHSGNPHYETGSGEETAIREGDFVLVDLWAKRDVPQGIYSDLTRTGFVGTTVPESYQQVLDIVARARDAAIDCVREAFAAGRDLQGWEVDQAARNVIAAAGYGPQFFHRTGHSIGQETHGNGANMDNLETRETRHVLRNACFSIEPGIYMPEFGVRSEVNVFVDASGEVHVTGGPLQREVVPILAQYPA